MDPILIGFLAYLVLLMIKGSLTFKYNKTIADFVLAGRRLGPWLVSFSERASGESAWLLIGLPGLALASGFNAIWPAIGCVSGILFSWVFISRRLRTQTEKHNALTIPDLFENRFSDNTHLLRVVSTVIIIFFFTIYVSAQFLAAGKVLNTIFGISQFQGMMIGAFIIVIYTIMGGFFAVAWTDLLQGAIMVFTLVLLPIVGLIELGGIDKLSVALKNIDPGLLLVGGGKEGFPMIASILGGLGIGLGYMGQPHLVTRFMAIRDPRKLRQGTLIAICWALLAFWGAVFIGIIGLGLFGNIFADQEQIMPYMTKTLVPAWLAGVLISGAIAAMMSTADSQLLVSTSAISRDIYHQMMKKDAPDKRLVMISRVATLIIGLIAFILALSAQSLVYWLVLYAWAGLGASFGPALLTTLWWKKVTKWGVFSGMVVGTITVLIWYNVPALKNTLYELIPGFFLSLLSIIIVSILTQKPTFKSA
ncbi:MAG: sodium/proline symporter [candidate division Zixibacteria bacterium]|nr:sodium/proline symporter [candidate division Zixibacteria bacterium]